MLSTLSRHILSTFWLGGADQYSLSGTDSRCLADRSRANSVSLPRQAPVLGLLWAGAGNAQQRRLSLGRRRAAPRQEAALHSGTKPESQSRSEKHLQSRSHHHRQWLSRTVS